LFGKAKMTSKNSHISKESFSRYLENQMSDHEQNLFERELQSNPFEAEALEGFQGFDSNQIQKDLNELKTKINPKKRKNQYRYWAAAASFLLIVTSGLIWFQLNEKSPIPEMAEIITVQKQEQKLVATDIQTNSVLENKTIQTPPLEDNINLETESKQKNNEGFQATKSKGIFSSKPPGLPENKENEEKIATQNSINKDIDIGEIKGGQTQAVVTESFISQPKGSSTNLIDKNVQNISNVRPTISERVSFNAIRTAENFPDSFAEAPIEEALPEITYHKDAKKTSLLIKTDSKVQPEIGMTEFKEYLKNNAILPNNFSKRKKTIRLLLKIDTNGRIFEIQNQNNADSLIFKKAKEIILSGSKWHPEIKNGILVNSQVEIKIVFKKEKLKF